MLKNTFVLTTLVRNYGVDHKLGEGMGLVHFMCLSFIAPRLQVTITHDSQIWLGKEKKKKISLPALWSILSGTENKPSTPLTL